MFGLNTQLSSSMTLTVQPPPTVASDLSSTYQFTTLTAKVQEPLATLPPSTVSTAFPCPVLPPCFLPTFLLLMRLQIQYRSRFSLSQPPHRSTLSLSISLTGPNTVHPLPLCHTPFHFLDRTMQLPKEALASPSTRPHYSTRPRSPPRSSLDMRSYR